MSVYTKLPLAGDSDVFRLLTIRPSEDLDSIICCDLSLARLSEKPPYEAITYRWGPESPMVAITVNGEFMSIRESLHAILQAFRMSTEPRVVWVDGLCINQDDAVAEKNHQVPLMTQIYSGCSHTIVWLGAGDREGRRALQNLFREPSRLEKLRGKTKPDYPRKVNELLRSEVFTRIWVIQEIALAPKVVVQYGSMAFSWDKLMSAISQNSFSGAILNPSAAQTGSGHLHPSSFTLLLESTRQRIQNKTQLTLVEALRSFQPFQAKYQVDKVFGLIGLLQAGQSINVDYKRASTDVFQECTQASLRETKTCQVLLSCVPRPLTAGQQNFPSWIPDWSDSDGAFPNLYQDALADEVFDACASTKLSSVSAPELGCLRLQGIVICHVEELGFSLPTIEEFRAKYWPAGKSLPRKALLQISTEFHTIFQNWKEVVKGACPIRLKERHDCKAAYPQHRYHTGEAFLEAFWNTINRGQPLLAEPEDQQRWEKYIAGYEQLIFLILPVISTVLGRTPWFLAWIIAPPMTVLIACYYAVLVLRRKIVLHAPPERPIFSQHGWVPGRTTENLIGLFPAKMLTSPTKVPTEVGDAIVLLRGGSRPFVLRQKGQKWRLIGDAYIHGIMFGAAFRDQDCVNFDLV